MSQNSPIMHVEEKKNKGIFNFTEPAKPVEEFDKKQDWTVISDQYNDSVEKDLLKEKAKNKEKDKDAKTRKNMALERLNRLKAGELFTDKDGNTIPKERIKKKIGTREETDEEYRTRLRNEIIKSYKEELDRSYAPVGHYEQKKDYFTNEKAENIVSPEHINNTFSDKRRMMMKKALVPMAKSDSMMLFGKSGDAFQDEAEKIFKKFLDDVIAYGEQSGEFMNYRIKKRGQKDRVHA